MSTPTITPAAIPGRLRLGLGERWTLAALCLGAGAAPLAARWISGDAATRVAYGLLVAAAYLALTLLARKASSLRPYWELSFAFPAPSR